MDIKTQIQDWLATIEDTTVFPVLVDWNPNSKRLTVLMDGDDGITIEQCRKVNKFLSAKLDENELDVDQYTLEVSSPGADKPLILQRQYKKHMGRELEVKLVANTILNGKLSAIDANGILLQLADKKKRYTDQSPLKTIEWDQIAEAKVIISFK
jgi:ribosome maturation factor RimP